MKHKHLKVPALLLSLLLCLSLLPSAAQAAVVASGICGDALTWSLDDAGMLTVSGTGAMYDYGNEDFDRRGGPWKSYNAQISAVVIGEGVTSIGLAAFEYCQMTSVSLPESLERIENGGFHNCYKLTSLSIPAAVSYLGHGFVENADALTAITVAEGNSVYCDIDDVLFSKDQTVLLCYPAGKEGASYAIPEGTVTLGNGAFRNSCLESVSIPSSVLNCVYAPFNMCPSLNTFTVAADNPAFYSSNGALINRTEKKLVAFAAAHTGSYTIPDGIETIMEWAFSLSRLDELVIPQSMTEIGARSFGYASSMKRITIPAGVTGIGERAFFNCTSLTDVLFTGTPAQWDAITVGKYNEPLTNAAVSFLAAVDNSEAAEVSFFLGGTETAPVCEAVVRNLEKSRIVILGACYLDGRFLGVKELVLEPNADGTLRLPLTGADEVRIFTVSEGGFLPLGKAFVLDV